MTSDARCPRCDRPQSECDRRDANLALWSAEGGRRVAVGEYVSAAYQEALTRVVRANEACRPVQWRERALRAEAEVARLRAMLDRRSAGGAR